MSLCVGSKKSVEDFGLRRKQYESPYLGRACNDLLGTTQSRTPVGACRPWAVGFVFLPSEIPFEFQ